MSKAWPADKVERMPVALLVPYAKNARMHSDAQVDQLVASIREWGVTMPVLVDTKNEVIAGHGRPLAAERLGLTEVPVMVARGWTKRQIKAYRLADNQLALNAAWDVKLLAAELGNLQGMEALIGFSPDELLRILGGRTGLTDPDDAPPLPEQPVTVLGDVWLLGKHRLLCGDATAASDVARLLGGVTPNLMVTDPPYGVEYDASWRARAGVNLNPKKLGTVPNDERADWGEAWMLFPGEIAYVWHASQHASEVQSSLVKMGFSIRAQIIWAKDRFALSRGDYHWQHEPCWYAVRKKGDWRGDRAQSTLWTIAAREDGGHGHSTQKPVECMRRPIVNNSSVGQAVYDPFLGSGTTIIAAEIEARQALGLDIDEAYCDVAVQRWQAFTGKAATLEGDGRSFDLIAEDRLGDRQSAA